MRAAKIRRKRPFIGTKVAIPRGGPSAKTGFKMTLRQLFANAERYTPNLSYSQSYFRAEAAHLHDAITQNIADKLWKLMEGNRKENKPALELSLAQMQQLPIETLREYAEKFGLMDDYGYADENLRRRIKAKRS